MLDTNCAFVLRKILYGVMGSVTDDERSIVFGRFKSLYSVSFLLSPIVEFFMFENELLLNFLSGYMNYCYQFSIIGDLFIWVWEVSNLDELSFIFLIFSLDFLKYVRL